MEKQEDYFLKKERKLCEDSCTALECFEVETKESEFYKKLYNKDMLLLFSLDCESDDPVSEYAHKGYIEQLPHGSFIVTEEGKEKITYFKNRIKELGVLSSALPS